MSGKVIDLFSKKTAGEVRQDEEKNTQLVEDHGRYVGSVSKQKADEIRSRIQYLDDREAQIDAMIQSWELHQAEHLEELQRIIITKGVTSYDPEFEDVVISEDGHMWIVDRAKTLEILNDSKGK